jgi:hypothetical protein
VISPTQGDVVANIVAIHAALVEMGPNYNK